MGQVYFSIPKKIVESVINRIDVPIFVETGTYKGDTAFWAAGHFKEVHTIELIEEISKSTQLDPACPKNVRFYVGDSAHVLPEVLKNINGRALYWLDGHWSPFVHQVDNQCPLMEELKTISERQDSIIFIDDATAFYGPMPPPHKAEQWPSLEEIFTELKTLFPSSRFTIMDDIIICAPEDAMQAIEAYWADSFNERFIHQKKQPQIKTPSAKAFGRKRILKSLLGFDSDTRLKNKPLREKLSYLFFQKLNLKSIFMLNSLKSLLKPTPPKKTVKQELPQFDFEVPDKEMYAPVFHPWHKAGRGEFKDIMNAIGQFTLVSPDRCHILYSIAQQCLQIEGEFYECGVYKGGTAFLLANVMSRHGKSNQTLHLFDTFEGMPETDQDKDWHKKGDFADTDISVVQERLQGYNKIEFHKGYIPDTFSGKENHKISLAHVDVDIYKSIIDSCDFIYPRMSKGGFFIFDDYGFLTCPGARKAVDEFFSDKPEQPIVLPTGQAIAVKL